MPSRFRAHLCRNGGNAVLFGDRLEVRIRRCGYKNAPGKLDCQHQEIAVIVPDLRALHVGDLGGDYAKAVDMIFNYQSTRPPHLRLAALAAGWGVWAEAGGGKGGEPAAG